MVYHNLLPYQNCHFGASPLNKSKFYIVSVFTLIIVIIYIRYNHIYIYNINHNDNISLYI